jgi:hypothetical protein
MRGYGTLLRKVVVGSAASLVAIAACSESSSVFPTEAPIIQGRGPAELSQSAQGDTFRLSITLDPKKSKTYDLGAGNSLYVPQDGVCDPDKSSYGPTEWDKPCVVGKKPINLTIKAWLNQMGYIRVDFEPALRFSPNGVTLLRMTDSRFATDPRYKIYYCPTLTGRCIDESVTDPTLVTVKVGNIFQRRIKHFSGYNVAARECTDPDCSNSDEVMASVTTIGNRIDGGRAKGVLPPVGRDTIIR